MLTEGALCNLSDEDVVLLAQSGDKEAMENIVLRYKRAVYLTAKRFFVDGYECDDIVQEGMIGLHSAIMGYEKGSASFKTFAMLCVTRRMVSILRCSKKKKHLPLDSYVSIDSAQNESGGTRFDELVNSLNPESLVIDEESVKIYEDTIKKNLSKLEYDVLSHHLQGLSYRDISSVLKISSKAVDNAVQRIRKKLSRLS